LAVSYWPKAKSQKPKAKSQKPKAKSQQLNKTDFILLFRKRPNKYKLKPKKTQP